MPVHLAKFRLGQAAFERTDNGTTQMAVNGLSAGSDEGVWDGTGAGDTGTDWTERGGVGTESAAAMHAGTNGLDSGLQNSGATSWFRYGSDRDIENLFTTLQFWLQPKAYPSKANLNINWSNDAGTLSGGSTLLVDNYVANMDLDVWQQVSIPLADFNLPIDVGRVRFYYDSSNPNPDQRHFIDEIKLTGGGGGQGPFTFEMGAPDATEQYHVKKIILTATDTNLGWNSGDFINLGNITNGLLLRHRRKSDSTVFWSTNMVDNVDLYSKLWPVNTEDFANSERMVTFHLDVDPAQVIVTDDDVLEVVVRDDFSGLINMRAYAHFGVEEVG